MEKYLLPLFIYYFFALLIISDDKTIDRAAKKVSHAVDTSVSDYAENNLISATIKQYKNYKP